MSDLRFSLNSPQDTKEMKFTETALLRWSVCYKASISVISLSIRRMLSPQSARVVLLLSFIHPGGRGRHSTFISNMAGAE